MIDDLRTLERDILRQLGGRHAQLEAEQRRIAAALTAAEEEIAAAEVELKLVKQAAYEALDLLADLGRAYRVADKLTRRAWNQAWFERIELERKAT